MTFAFSRDIKPVSWCGERVKDIIAHHHYWLHVNTIWYNEELTVWKCLQAQGLEGYKENASKKIESEMRRQQSLEINQKRLRRRSRRERGSLRRPRRLRSQRDLKAELERRALAVVVRAVLVS